MADAIFVSDKLIEKGEEEQYKKKNIPEAIRHYENALQVVQHGLKFYKTTNTPEPLGLKINLRDIHCLLGMSYSILGRQTDFFHHSKEAVKIQETIKMNDYHANVIFFHYATHLFEKKRFDEANVYVEKCLKSMRVRLGDLKACLYVNVFRNIGTYYFREKHYEDQCLDFSKKANYIVLQIQKNKKCQDSECIDCLEYAGPEYVADTHENLAHILAKLQKHEKALHEFIRAFKVRAEHKLPLKDILGHLDALIKKERHNPKFMAAVQQLRQLRVFGPAATPYYCARNATALTLSKEKRRKNKNKNKKNKKNHNKPRRRQHKKKKTTTKTLPTMIDWYFYFLLFLL